jgi:hypothetical protein
MGNIKSTAELLEAIQILEAEQADHLQQVREKFYYTRQSLRPVNIIGNSLKGMVSSPNLFKNILGTALGLFAGYLGSKAIFIGASNSKSRRIFGNVLKFGVASIVARGPKVFTSFKQFIARRIYRMREKNNIKQ